MNSSSNPGVQCFETEGTRHAVAIDGEHPNASLMDLQRRLAAFEGASQLIVVSNRQPYTHRRLPDGGAHVSSGAGGLVTALEPILQRSCGLWIAHGNGDADADWVDEFDRVAVPPDDPSYRLRRVWLSETDEEGYYGGFSNEGLWPLCHETPVSPQFRLHDWDVYRSVNAQFADAVVHETTDRKPIILVQDYHLALLPGLIRARRPESGIVLFWHVPWPTPDRFELCPWRTEILKQMLQADIVGFNTHEYCQRFLACVDRFIPGAECTPTVVRTFDRDCRVAAYPESIEWEPSWLSRVPSVSAARAAVRERYDLEPELYIALGVDRWDFTKGIPEKFLALERLFGKHPEYRGTLTLLQVAAPSRTALPEYKALQHRTVQEASRINAEFGTACWRPIVLVTEELPRETIYELYRGADMCWVNSLHDGMNLVAKEFIAARDDEDGVLLLSCLTGASTELNDAIHINPHNIEAVANKIAMALRLPSESRRTRMLRMRSVVRTNDAFRWGERILADVAAMGN